MNDPVANQLTDISKLLKSVDNSLSQLATIARLPLLYSGDQSQRLIAEYRQLRDSHHKASVALHAATSTDSTSYEQNVRLHGEEEAKILFAPIQTALNAKQAVSNAVDDFEREHPLIQQIVTGWRPMAD